MIDIEIKINRMQMAQIQRLLREFPKEMPTAMAGAINDTAKDARNYAANELYKELNLKKSYIKSLLKISKAKRTKQSAMISISGRRPGLIHFSARQTSKGVGYKITRRGGRKSILHAFIQEVKGAKNVWIRVRGKGPSGLVPRKPITRLEGPSPAKVISDSPAMSAKIKTHTSSSLEYNISRRIHRILNWRATG